MKCRNSGSWKKNGCIFSRTVRNFGKSHLTAGFVSSLLLEVYTSQEDLTLKVWPRPPGKPGFHELAGELMKCMNSGCWRKKSRFLDKRSGSWIKRQVPENKIPGIMNLINKTVWHAGIQVPENNAGSLIKVQVSELKIKTVVSGIRTLATSDKVLSSDHWAIMTRKTQRWSKPQQSDDTVLRWVVFIVS